MTTFHVTLLNTAKNFQQTLEIPKDSFILEEAAELGVKIPFECVVGSCGICQGKLITGTVDQSEQIFLSEAQIEDGWVLTCVAKPTSDCVLSVDLDDYI
jgi:2Fe-2S type ferredoxin